MAIRFHHTDAALLLLDAGAAVDDKGDPSTGPYLRPPLHEALKRGNKTIVEKILECDINIRQPHSYATIESTSLELATWWGDIEIIEALISMGAEMDSGYDRTPLAMAVSDGNKQLVELFFRHGADPNARSTSGLTPLEAAAINSDIDMTRLLISKGADPSRSAAFVCAESCPTIFDILLDAFSMRYPLGIHGFGGTTIISAIEQDDEAQVQALLKAKLDVNGFCEVFQDIFMTPLGFAIHERKSLDLVLMLLDASLDPNGIVAKPLGGKNWVHQVWPLETALLLAVKTKKMSVIELLLNKGADVNHPARKGVKRTPLQQACEIGSFQITQLLLSYGAEVNAPPAERGGGTALQLASIVGSIKIAQLLLDNGADVHATPSIINGKTAFEGAAEYGCLDMLKVLWDAALPVGFDPEQIQKAKDLAKSKGHGGCADYIDLLALSTTNSALAQDSLLDYGSWAWTEPDQLDDFMVVEPGNDLTFYGSF